MLLTCILYRDAGSGCLIRTVGCQVLCCSFHGPGHGYHIYLCPASSGCCSFSSRKLYVCLRDVLMFLASICSSFCLSSSLIRFIPPMSAMFVLAPHDSNMCSCLHARKRFAMTGRKGDKRVVVSLNRDLFCGSARLKMLPMLTFWGADFAAFWKTLYESEVDRL